MILAFLKLSGDCSQGNFSSERLYVFLHCRCMMHVPSCRALTCVTLLAEVRLPASKQTFVNMYAEPLSSMMDRQLVNQLKVCGAHKNNCSVEVANCTCKGTREIVLLSLRSVVIKCRGLASYFGGPGLKSPLGVSLPSLRFLAVFLSPSEVSAYYLEARPLPSHSY